MEDIFGRARAGDRDALAMLFRMHQHLLLRYFRGMGAQAPDDLASQVWIDVATGLSGFVGDEVGFRRWMFTIARRRHVDSIRRSVRTPEQVDIALASAESDRSAADAFEAGDSLARALALVRRLPRDMADAVLLRVVADLDVADVAAVMGKSEGNVRVLVHRGVTRLRQIAVTDGARQAIITAR